MKNKKIWRTNLERKDQKNTHDWSPLAEGAVIAPRLTAGLAPAPPHSGKAATIGAAHRGGNSSGMPLARSSLGTICSKKRRRHRSLGLQPASTPPPASRLGKWPPRRRSSWMVVHRGSGPAPWCLMDNDRCEEGRAAHVSSNWDDRAFVPVRSKIKAILLFQYR
jgi:hypothetical protein